ncbi:MAG: CAP domain-containing protein [Methylotenera sp.]
MMKFTAFAILTVALLSASPAYAAKVDPVAIVAAHNKLRAEVGVTKKLSYSTILAASAQAWANNLKRTNGCQMRHSEPNGKYGENLFWGSAVDWTDGRKELQKVSSKRVVENWGSEKADYDYSSNQCAAGAMCGHYTQIVWSDTNKVGCGVAVCEDTLEQVWACQYQPAGNWVGKRPY